MHLRLLNIAIVIAGLSCAGIDAFAADNRAGTPHYQWRREHDPDGIGKFFMGREIAQVMGPAGLPWLERATREEEEQPDVMLGSLDIRPGDVVVDLGAGSGYHTFKLSERVGPKGSVLAVDIEPKMLAFIRKRAAREGRFNVGLVQNSATDAHLPHGRIDLVLLVDVYHELSSPVEMMSSVRTALKPKGRVAVVEYRTEDPNIPIKPLHKMSDAQLRREFAALGFRHIETINSLPFQHIAIFGK